MGFTPYKLLQSLQILSTKTNKSIKNSQPSYCLVLDYPILDIMIPQPVTAAAYNYYNSCFPLIVICVSRISDFDFLPVYRLCVM